MGENNKVNESLLKDDLYQAVNGEWLKTAVIPADRPTAGGFSELDLNIEKILMNDLGEMLEGKNVLDVVEQNFSPHFHEISIHRLVAIVCRVGNDEAQRAVNTIFRGTIFLDRHEARGAFAAHRAVPRDGYA